MVRMRIAPNMATGVGRSFPGEGDHNFPGTLNDRTVRNTRVRAEPRIRDRVQHGADWDAPMPALRLGPPWQPAPDAVPASAPPAGGAPLPGRTAGGQ